MDGETFDTMLRRMHGVATRRGVLRAGLDALAATGLAVIGLSTVHNGEAVKKHGKKRCRKRGQRCHDRSQCCPVRPGANFKLWCHHIEGEGCNLKQRRCCATMGHPCQTDCDCCGQMTCDDDYQCAG